MTLLELLQEQRKFSLSAFGPEPRLEGVLDHLKKELQEVQAATLDVTEWADCFLLGIDGAMRAGGHEDWIDSHMMGGDVPAALVWKNAFDVQTLQNEAGGLTKTLNSWPHWSRVTCMILLAAYQHGHVNLIQAAAEKLEINKARSWPDWRTVPADRAIEHIKN